MEELITAIQILKYRMETIERHFNNGFSAKIETQTLKTEESLLKIQHLKEEITELKDIIKDKEAMFFKRASLLVAASSALFGVIGGLVGYFY